MATDFEEILYLCLKKNRLRIWNAGFEDITNPDYRQNVKAWLTIYILCVEAIPRKGGGWLNAWNTPLLSLINLSHFFNIYLDLFLIYMFEMMQVLHACLVESARFSTIALFTFPFLQKVKVSWKLFVDILCCFFPFLWGYHNHI